MNVMRNTQLYFMNFVQTWLTRLSIKYTQKLSRSVCVLLFWLMWMVSVLTCGSLIRLKEWDGRNLGSLNSLPPKPSTLSSHAIFVHKAVLYFVILSAGYVMKWLDLGLMLKRKRNSASIVSFHALLLRFAITQSLCSHSKLKTTEDRTISNFQQFQFQPPNLQVLVYATNKKIDCHLTNRKLTI